MTKPRWRVPRLFAAIRVLALLTLCLLVSLVALFRVSQARAGDVLVELGAQLMRLPDAFYANDVQRLSLNGLTLLLQSGSSPRGSEDVLQQFYTACKAGSQMQLTERQSEHIEPLMTSEWFRNAVDGVLVRRGKDGAAVVCIDAQGKPWDLAGITESAQRFVESGELSELGQLRYAWVRPSGTGSVFLTLWTEGSTRLLEQFPRTGDAPGVDFPDVGRVPGSQRYLSAQLADSLLAIYRHQEGQLDELSERYHAALEAGGYRSVGRPAKGKDGHAFSYEKGRRHVLLTLTGGPAKSSAVMATILSQP